MAWNVVIAGGGFGGAAAARCLERLMPKQSARLVLVNDVNFMLYTPFLPEAAAGTLEPRHVVTPLREMLDRTYLRLGSVAGHDPASRTVELRTHEGETEELRYDQLLLALGSVSRTLPIPGLGDHAIGFKSLADAIWLRNHVVENLEAANATEDRERREKLLTFVFVGGGYAGLEALAELQDFAADAMDSYPRARLTGMRWILVEAAERVLPEIDAQLADYAVRELRGRGIDVRLGTTLKEVTAESATLSTGETVPTRTVVWTAGVTAHPSLRQLNVPLDERGRVPVDEYLRVKGMDSVWALGDCAAAPDPRGGFCPPTAQHAVRQGPIAARNIAAELGIGTPKKFEYRSEAAFVNLGRYKAVGRIGQRTFRGFPAWWMARTYHMSQIPGSARKVRAVLDWTASLPFRRDISEVGSIGHPGPLRDEVYERGGSHRPVAADGGVEAANKDDAEG
jgi:NADH dehydrogenase